MHSKHSHTYTDKNEEGIASTLFHTEMETVLPVSAICF